MSPGYRDLERSDEKDPFEMSNLKYLAALQEVHHFPSSDFLSCQVLLVGRRLHPHHRRLRVPLVVLLVHVLLLTAD